MPEDLTQRYLQAVAALTRIGLNVVKDGAAEARKTLDLLGMYPVNMETGERMVPQ